jgi:hypothetical protein
VLKVKIDEPANYRVHIFRLVRHPCFDYFLSFCIVLNTLVMAIKSHRMSAILAAVSENANTVFALIYNAEMILKIAGLGRIYFLDQWNNFDAFVVIATDLGMILDLFQVGAGFSTAASVIRGFRIMRLFRLVKSFQNLRLILDTIFNILPQIGNFMSLYILLLFIYAALGVNLFSGVRL